MNSWAALKFVRRALLQDLPFIWDEFPDLEIFSANIFRIHAEGWQKWQRIQKQTVASVSQLRKQRMSVLNNLDCQIVNSDDIPPKGFKVIPIDDQGTIHLGILKKVCVDCALTFFSLFEEPQHCC